MLRSFRIEIIWGTVWFLLSTGWIWFERRMGWHAAEIDKHAGFSILFAIPVALLYWVALLHIRRSRFNGIITWRQGFSSGMKLSFVIMLLSPFVQILFHKVISPEYFPNMIKFATTIENRDRAAMESFFTLGNFIYQAMKDALLWGAAASALAALLTRRKGKH